MHTQLGFLYYSTNSTLSPRYPNEWEFYGRWLAISQDAGAPFDLGGQVGYNLAVQGLDRELSIGRVLGLVRLIGVTRLMDDPSQGGHADVALGGGLVLPAENAPGLLPALWSHGTGAEVMQRIAAPMIGGMVTSTILTLVVIPALYFLWRRRGLEGSDDAALWKGVGDGGLVSP